MKDYIGSNIRVLRKMFGETQLDLAFALGYSTPTTISNYELGARTPKPDDRIKIAAHYRIPVGLLTSNDLSFLSAFMGSYEQLDSVISESDWLRIIHILTPTAYSEEAAEIEGFRSAYAEHMLIMVKLITGEKLDYDCVAHCMSQYQAICQKYTCYEAEVNLLSLFFVYWDDYYRGKTYNDNNAKCLNRMSTSEWIREYYLRSFDEPIDTGETEEICIDMDFKKGMDLSVLDLVSRLYASSKWHEIAEFYMAKRYMSCLITTNNFSDDQNIHLGNEMMAALFCLHNKYARNYYSFILEYLAPESDKT